jgi:hypothetical protein
MLMLRDILPAIIARPRVIRGTQTKPLPLLPSGPGGVRSRPLHEARSLTNHHPNKSVQTKSDLACFFHKTST